MTYPPQPGQSDNWPDSSWSSPDPYQDPAAPASSGGWVDPYSVPPNYQQPVYPSTGYPAGMPQSPPYAPPPQPYPVFPVTGQTNGLAIAALVCSIIGIFMCGVVSFIGAILGHIARKQIAERGESGDGMALAGIILGWIVFAIYAVIMLIYVGFWAYIVGATSP